MPRSMSTGSELAYLSPDFAFTCGGICPDPIPAAFERYQSLLFWAGPGAAPPAGAKNVITGLVTDIATDAPLALGVPENYTLTVDSSGLATLSAATQWGALRGIESFAQLPAWTYDAASDANAYTITSTPVSIVDYPRFPYRSVLIDTSRHFLPLDAILSTLDAMTQNKFNRLHWHIVDDQSWPLQSTTYPNFTLGAYAPDAVYTHADVSTVVQAAWERGIIIVPEFDGPAHATAWGTGYPNLVISCPDGQSLLNPTEAGGVYTVIEGLLAEFIPLFKTDMVHWGGDEVEDTTCWEQSPQVQAFAKAQGFTTMDQVRNYFELRLQSIAKSFNVRSAFWEEVFDGGYTINPGNVVDVWLSDQELLNAVTQGHFVIGSFGLYLDQQIPAGPTHYLWQDTWQNFYLEDPIRNATLTPEEVSRVLGLSTSMWGEQVDESDQQTRMWPRAAAAAERMWSDPNLRDIDDAEARLDHLRCKMWRRGIRAGPITPASVHGFCATLTNTKKSKIVSAVPL